MGSLTDLNVTNLEKGKYAASLGDAHELIVAGILARLGFEVGLISVKSNPYDLWVIGYEKPNGSFAPLRVQVKTVTPTNRIKFIGGVRAGTDRTYKSGVKEYKYSEKENDIIIGVKKETLDFYIIPTKYLKKWGKSKSINLIQSLKNNWDILLNWNDNFLVKLEKSLK